MEIINDIKIRIGKKINPKPIEYSCNLCKDTTWIEGENGYRRCECYNKTLAAERWKKFGVDPERAKTLEEFKVTTQNQDKIKKVALDYIDNFDTIQLQRNNSLALLGNSGTGKTHIALSIGRELINKYRVVYFPYIECMRQLKINTLDEEYYNKLLSKYITSDILIIDDLFKDKIKNGKITELTEADLKHIYPIINQRYISGKATIYSSEFLPSQLLDLDEAIGGRIIEQCKNRIIVFKDKNYRTTFK